MELSVGKVIARKENKLQTSETTQDKTRNIGQEKGGCEKAAGERSVRGESQDRVKAGSEISIFGEQSLRNRNSVKHTAVK